jgi:hypothetical protein
MALMPGWLRITGRQWQRWPERVTLPARLPMRMACQFGNRASACGRFSLAPKLWLTKVVRGNCLSFSMVAGIILGINV